MTFPELFAIALGVPLNPGAHRCFWCGATCDDQFAVKVTDTFWDWDAVAFPSSRHQCAGCCECLSEKRKLDGYDKPQKTRNHSWLATSRPEVQSLNKGTLERIRDVCLRPPSGVSWGLAIAESGQKHVLYRTPVNAPDATACAVQLELTTIRYDPLSLADAVVQCAILASVLGRPSLSGPIDAGAAIRLAESDVDPQRIEEWNAVWNAPLWRLAAFLCPGKDDCHAYLAAVDAGAVPQATGGADRRAGQRCLEF